MDFPFVVGKVESYIEQIFTKFNQSVDIIVFLRRIADVDETILRPSGGKRIEDNTGPHRPPAGIDLEPEIGRAAKYSSINSLSVL